MIFGMNLLKQGDFLQKKLAMSIIYDATTTKYKVSLFFFKVQQTFFEILSYFSFLPNHQQFKCHKFFF